jgi:hypothetical protein
MQQKFSMDERATVERQRSPHTHTHTHPHTPTRTPTRTRTRTTQHADNMREDTVESAASVFLRVKELLALTLLGLPYY